VRAFLPGTLVFSFLFHICYVYSWNGDSLLRSAIHITVLLYLSVFGYGILGDRHTTFRNNSWSCSLPGSWLLPFCAAYFTIPS
jgi:hypothetical protein